MTITAPAQSTARTFARMLQDAAARWPDNEALVIADQRRSYRELLVDVERFAAGLAARGIGTDDHVGILLPNSVNYVVATFATSLVGATCVPYNTRFKADELAYVLSDSRPAFLITTNAINDYTDLPDLVERSSELQQQTYPVPGYATAPILVLCDGASESAFFTTDDTPPSLNTAPRYSAIIYTSGTTSRPRGAQLTAEVFEHWRRVAALWELTDGDRFWDPCPLFHIAGIGPLIWTINAGATFISDTYFDAGAGLRQIEAERATLLYPTYPPIMRGLMTHESFASTDLSSVRAFLNVAPPEDLRAMQAAIPHATGISLYGSTEGGPVTMHRVSDSAEFRLMTNGRPVDGVQVRIYDSATASVIATNQPGEIQYRGPNTFSGYLNDPRKTAETLDSEGWVHTGDLGRVDESGTLFYLGRVNEMIKVGGENVAPAEVEEVLAMHPAVKLCQVVGIPDERLVEVVAAFVELLPGSITDVAELLEFSRQRMARYKVPAVIRIVDSWPMSATKIQRAKLRELLEAESK